MEAFITPILLNYVQKYVNLRPQDAQLSLWEGDAVFQNLDLRLDVLQSEFQLPFEFLSGHIHELIIHIPWTKITSEPISITINTIEFVLKLCDFTSRPIRKQESLKLNTSQDDAPKGYITSLVEKIVKNISITCNNIILKYVEEEIVVSMNIQLLSFCSADSQWKPSFNDISSPKVLLRKVVQVSDLTICLDKRNLSGQIEVCQEPILYRCSLEARIIFKYNLNLATSSSLIVQVYTKSLDLNVSSLQFPMLMRLIELGMSLQSGKLQDKYAQNSPLNANDSLESEADSTLSWAWSKLPSFFQQDDSEENSQLEIEQALSMSVYISALKVTIKSSELLNDTIVQTSRKIHYNPIVRFNFNGNFFEMLSCEREWFNARAGISQLSVESLAGVEDLILFSGDEATDSYLSGSLFDVNPNNTGKTDIPMRNLNLEWHLNEFNESYFGVRSPAVSFDLVRYVRLQDGQTFDELTEYNNYIEAEESRIFVSGLVLKHNASLRVIVGALNELVKSYDYPAYVEETHEREPTKLPPPLMDDYDALMNNIPQKKLFLKVSGLKLEMHVLHHSLERLPSKISQKRMSSVNSLPQMIINIRHLALHSVAPIHEDRLVHTTCQLPVKPKRFLDACYKQYDLKVEDTSFTLLNNTVATDIGNISEITLSSGILLQKECWSDDIEQYRGICSIENIHVLISRQKQTTLMLMSRSLMNYNQKIYQELLKLSEKRQTRRESCLEIDFHNVSAGFKMLPDTLITNGFIESMSAYFVHDKYGLGETKNKLAILEAPKKELSGKLMQWKIQWPLKQGQVRVALFKVRESKLILHECLKLFMNFDEVIELSKSSADVSYQNAAENKVSHTVPISERQSRKIYRPDETIHASSDKDEKFEISSNRIVSQEREAEYWKDMMPNLSNLVISVEIDQFEILFPEDHDQTEEISQNIIEKRVLVVRLPAISCKSSNQVHSNFESTFPINVNYALDNINSSGFSWKIDLSELSVSINQAGKSTYILSPVKTSVTMAFDTRDSVNSPNFRLNLHFDTESVIFDVHDDQILFLRQSIDLLVLLQNYLLNDETSVDVQSNGIQPSFDDDVEIKEFLGFNFSSELSADVASSNNKSEINGGPKVSRISIWVQWTFTKITLNFYMSNASTTAKLILDMEDFITSIDKQDFYFKLKSKVGALAAEYYNLDENSKWIVSEDLKMTAQLQTSENERQNSFFELTFTTAEVNNIFRKWGTIIQSNDVSNTLSEIVINLKAIHFQLSVKGVNTIMPFLYLLTSNEKKELPKKESNGIPMKILSVSDLPLLHFDCKGLVFYVHSENEVDDCNVLVFQIGSIKIRPNAENPLNRTPIRPDIYTKAEQLRILNTPGSKIEDRQYELIINNISAVTSIWTEMLSLLKRNSIAYNTNPAVEWNNIDKKPPVTFEEIFQNCQVSVIFAPCIFYKNTIICGQSLEVNFLTDLSFDVTIDQLIMINNILKSIPNATSVAPNDSTRFKKRSLIHLDNSKTIDRQQSAETISENERCNIKSLTNYNSLIQTNKNKKTQRRKEQGTCPPGNIKTDSGFSSLGKGLIKKSSSNLFIIPFEISLVAGVFYFKLFQKLKDKTVPASTSMKSDSILLIKCKIIQPSMLIAQHMYEYTIKYSIFEVSVKLGDSSTSTGTDVLFETEKGNLNIAGIAPPLLAATYKKSLTKKVCISCCIGRPIRMHICESALDTIFHLNKLAANFLPSEGENSGAKSSKAITRGTPLRMLRNILFDADTLSISFDQLQFDCICRQKTGIKMRIFKSTLEVATRQHPESIDANCNIESLFVQTSSQTLLHPLSLQCSLLLKQEHWNRAPAVTVKVKFDLVNVDISPKNILDLYSVFTSISSTLSLWTIDSAATQLKLIETDYENRSTKLKEISVPSGKRKENLSCKKEYFQDDLRVGAFQIIETDEDNSHSLPLPYQMKISNRTICWRYPQLRYITKLLLYPILLEGNMSTLIKCRLEYYNEAQDEFISYADFTLSEIETHLADLPEVQMSASVWKVIVENVTCNNQQSMGNNDKQQSGEKEENENDKVMHIDDFLSFNEPEMIGSLHPKELVGCIRIDSLFQFDDIPIFQALVRLPYLQINLKNDFDSVDQFCPPPIRHFTIANDFCRNHTAVSLHFSNVKFYTMQKKTKANLAIFELIAACKVLDSKYLNMLELMEPVSIKGLISNKITTDCNIVVDAIRLNLGATIMRTVLTSKLLWDQILSNNRSFVPIITGLVICNSTNIPFHFGQTNGSEQILLKPNECSFYAFENGQLKDQLTFTFEDILGSKSCNLNTYCEEVQYLQNKNCYVIAVPQRLSSTQVCFFIKGQVEILSMSKEPFEVQYKTNNVKQYLNLGLHGHATLIGDFRSEQHSSIRLQLAERGKGWSGEIPLTSKTVPWLVKVPSSKTDSYESFWVKIIEEDIQTPLTNGMKQKRFLVLIWPMFVVRSLLSIKTALTDVNKSEYQLIGNGEEMELTICGDNYSEHELYFGQILFKPQNDNKIILTYKDTDWSSFLQSETKRTSIDAYIESLKQSKKPQQEFSDNDVSPPIVSTSNLRTIICSYRVKPMRAYSPAMMLEIYPYCLFMNSTGAKVTFINTLSGETIEIENNSKVAISTVEESFRIQVNYYGTNWSDSPEIYMNDSSFKSSHSKHKILLPDKGFICFSINYTSTISEYVLSSTDENNVRVIQLTSTYCVVNLSDIALEAVCFVLDDNSQVLEQDIADAMSKVKLNIDKRIPLTKAQGVPINSFLDMRGRKCQKSNMLLKHYICFFENPSKQIILPLSLSKSFQRKCFSIICENNSVPLVASVVDKNGQFVLSIYCDRFPKYQIYNYTDLTFFVAGTKSPEWEKASRIISDTNDKNFEWFQRILPKSDIFYTPVEFYLNFPDSENVECNLSLALCLNSKQYGINKKLNIRWSKPLRAESNRETLLNIPYHGDVKILICDAHKTIKVYIYYITQGMEFSVKELRTRLSNPDTANDQAEESNEAHRRIKQQPLYVSNQYIPDSSCIECSNRSPQKIPNLNIFVNEASVNIVIDSKSEGSKKDCILSMYLYGMLAQLKKEDRSLFFAVSDMQIDNSLYGKGNYDFPVTMCAENYLSARDFATNVSIYTAKGSIEQLCSSALLFLRFGFYEDFTDIETVHCKIGPLKVYIEDTYVNDLLDRIIDCAPSNAVHVYENASLPQHISHGYVPVPGSAIEEVLYFSGSLQLKSFKIEPISLMLSVHTCIRLYIALDHSPLYFTAFEKINISTVPIKLGNAIGMHYLSGAIFGAGWVVGSLEILGSPGGLARSVSTGLKDFVSLPVQGLLRGPWGFFAGVTQGSVSLLRNVTAGTVNSLTKLAASVARNLDRLTLDQEHFQRTEALRRIRPQGLAEGLTQGLTGLGISMLGALGGLARHPLEARSSVEVVTGVAKGIVGAFAKPLSGAAELLALTGQGVLHTVGFNAMPARVNENVCCTLTAGPAECKLAWKYMPNHFATLIHQLLFYHDATLVTKDILKRVGIAVTPKAFIILYYDTDFQSEIFPIQQIHITLDPIDKTFLEIVFLQAEEINDGDDSDFFNNRMLSFLRDSSDNLRSSSINSIKEILTKNSSYEKRYRSKRAVYMSENFAIHLVRYINVLKTIPDFLEFPVHS